MALQVWIGSKFTFAGIEVALNFAMTEGGGCAIVGARNRQQALESFSFKQSSSVAMVGEGL